MPEGERQHMSLKSLKGGRDRHLLLYHVSA